MNRRDFIRDHLGGPTIDIGSPKGPPRNFKSGLTAGDWMFREPETYGARRISDGYTPPPNQYSSPRRRHIVRKSPLVPTQGDKIRPNSYYMNVDDFRYPIGTAYGVTSSGWECNNSGSVTVDGNSSNNITTPLLSHDPDIPGSLYNEAVSKFYEKVGSTMMLNVEAFEAASLRHRNTIDKSCRTLEKTAKEIRRRATKTRGFVRSIARLWLLKQYVIQPAVSSIFDSSLKVLQAHQRPVYVKVSSRRDYPVEQSRLASYGFGIPKTTLYEKGNYSLVQKFGCVLQSNDLGIQDFVTLDPLLLGYSVLPLSFVLDWVYNVSSFLADKEAACRYQSQFRYGYATKSWKYESEYRSDASWSDPNGFYRYGSLHVQGSLKRRGFRRSVLTSLPKVQAPVVDVRLGAQRLLSAASLLTQLLSPGKDYDYRRNFRP